jgi:hypothetical protein
LAGIASQAAPKSAHRRGTAGDAERSPDSGCVDHPLARLFGPFPPKVEGTAVADHKAFPFWRRNSSSRTIRRFATSIEDRTQNAIGTAFDCCSLDAAMDIPNNEEV